MDPFTIAALGTGLTNTMSNLNNLGSQTSGFLGSLGSMFSGNSSRKDFNRQKEFLGLQHQYGWEQTRYAREEDRRDRDFANEYNSPSAQLQRLKDAGLSPGMMYSGGQASTPSAASLGSSGMAGGSAPGLSSAAHDANSIRAAELAKLSSEVAVNNSVAERNNSETNLLNPLRAELLDAQSSAAWASAENTRAKTVGQDLTNFFDHVTLDARATLTELDVNRSLSQLELLANEIRLSDTNAVYAQETLDDRINMVNRDLELKGAMIALTQVRAELSKHQISLTDAQILEAGERCKSEMSYRMTQKATERYIREQAATESYRRLDMRQSITESKERTRLLRKQGNWHGFNQIVGAVRGTAETVVGNYTSPRRNK